MSPLMFRSKPFQDGGGNGDLRSVEYPVALFLIVFAVMIAAFAAVDSSDESDASEITIGDLKYELDQTGHKAIVVGYKEGTPAELVVPSWVIHEDLTYFVTTIKGNAFWKCTSLVSLEIGEHVEVIENTAFYGCTSLETVTFDSGSKLTSIWYGAFWGCTSLASVTIPDSVTSIGKEAFRDCTSLASVTVPDFVTYVEEGAFNHCTSLKSVKIGDRVETIDTKAFYDCKSLEFVIIGDSVTSIGDQSFGGCAELSSLTLGKSVRSIESSAFNGCASLAFLTLDCTMVGPWFKGVKSITSVTIGDSVTSIGDEAFHGCTSLGSVEIGDRVETIDTKVFYDCTSLASVTIGDSVTSIGDQSFGRCAELSSLTLGKSVISIKSSAFNGCTSLTSLTLDCTTVGPWFKGVKSITSVTIGDSVTSIGDEAFHGCTSLGSVTIGDSVTSIGDEAFHGCTSLISITVGENNTKYSSDNGVLFNKEKTELIQYPMGNTRTSYSAPDSVTSVGNYAFYGCTSLASVTLGSSVGSIGNYAFEGCTKLASVTIPNSVTSVGNYAFNGCTSLASVTFGNNSQLGSIGDSAFYGCTKLASVTIPNSVTSVGTYVFYGCTSLGSVTIGSSVGSIRDYAFWGCTSLTSVIIPDSVTSVGNYAFEGCTFLTSVTIPDSVGSIGDYAFYGCTSLGSAVMGGSVEFIGTHAFEGCTSLTSLTVFDLVKAIGDYAFRGCTSLGNIVFVTASWNIAYVGAYQFSLGTQDVSVSATVYSPSNIADGKLDDYGGSYTGFTYLSSPLKIVRFNANGGSCSVPFMLTDADGKLASLPDAARDRYTFGGWYTQAEGGEEITTSYVFTEDTTVYAHWDVIHVTGVSLDKTSVVLDIGDSAKLVATVTPSDASFPTVTWTASDPSIANVSSDGTITAMKAGTVAIKAAADGKEAVCTVTVPYPVFTVTFNPKGGSCSVPSMETTDGKLASLPDAARDRYTFGGWYTQAEGGEEITTSYVFTEDTTVYAHWDVIHVTGVALDKTSLSLDCGAVSVLTATVFPTEATETFVLWSSSDPSVAAVSDGTVTAVSAGTAVIKVTTEDGGYTATCTVEVSNSIIVEPESEIRGDKAVVNVQDAIAKMDEAVGKGYAPIVDIDVSDKSGVSEVVIDPAVAEKLAGIPNSKLTFTTVAGTVILSREALSGLDLTSGDIGIAVRTVDVPSEYSDLGITAVYDLAVLYAGREKPVQFGTDVDARMPYRPAFGEDTSKLKVYYLKGDGGVEAVDGYYANGYVWFTTTHFSMYATLPYAAVSSLTLDKTSVPLEVGSTVKLTATVSPSDATFPTVTWTTSDADIATVLSDGTVAAMKAGTVTIRAVADGKEATCTVTVNDAPSPGPTPSSGGGFPVIAIVGVVLAVIAVAGVAIILKKRSETS